MDWSDIVEGDVTKDEPNVRVKEILGRTLNFKRTDPYGFWRISYPAGEMPEGLKDEMFTSVDLAVLAAKTFFAKRDLEKPKKRKDG